MKNPKIFMVFGIKTEIKRHFAISNSIQILIDCFILMSMLYLCQNSEEMVKQSENIRKGLDAHRL